MKEVNPNSPAAVKFLRAMFPNGPWLLVSIDPEDRARMDVGTFGPKSLSECEAFLKRHNGVHNIYFHVNPVMRRMHKKARREDIKEVVQFHVDVDPRPGQDIEEEQRRALKLLTEDRLVRLVDLDDLFDPAVDVSGEQVANHVMSVRRSSVGSCVRLRGRP